MNRFTIQVSPQELNLPLCVMSGQVFRWKWVGENEIFGADNANAYWIKLRGDGIYEVETNATQAEFERFFRLEDSLSALLKTVLETGPELAPYIGKLSGLRVLRPERAAETAISFLCTANNNLSRIIPMVNHLADYGEPVLEHRAQIVRRFPDLDVIAAIPEAELRAKGFGYRAKSIPEAARHILEKGGEPWLNSLRESTYEEAFDALCSVKGIGPKLADCIALFGLHHLEAVPVDTHLWQAACRLYFPEFTGKVITSTRYRAIGNHFRTKFGAKAGWAHQFLFYDNLQNWREYRKAGGVPEADAEASSILGDSA